MSRSLTSGASMLVAAIACASALAGPPPTITNVTTMTPYPTIQAAASAAANGDVIEIGAGTIFEDNIIFPNGIDFTLRGAGMDVTIIDGGAVSDANPVLRLLNTSQSASAAIEDLTLANSINTSTNGGAVALQNASPTFRRVAFRNCVGSDPGTACISAPAGCSSLFDRCVFTGSSASFFVARFTASNPTLVQCLFADNAVTTACSLQDGSIGVFLNCTISATSRSIAVVNGAPSMIQATNCVLLGIQIVSHGGTITQSRCLSPGAAGDNIDGSPTFVDAAMGDYRLASGSLGIDAADSAAYAAVGGGLFDLAGAARSNNDSGVADTGSGPFTFLDVGAYEFQGHTPPSCPADQNGDGAVNSTDLALTLGAWGPCP